MYEKVPEQLKKLHQWVCFKLYPSGKTSGRMEKKPISPHTGMFAKSNAPGTWGSFQAAVEGMKRHNAHGIGLMFANGICGVDIDHCVEDGELSPLAEEIVDALESYTEFSPSGTGIHVLCLGKLPDTPGRRSSLGLEMYDTGRFFTVTGQAYNDREGKPYPLRDCTEELAKLHKKYLAKSQGEQAGQGQNKPLRAGKSLPDEQLLKLAFQARNGEKFQALFEGRWENCAIGDGSQSAADQAFCNMLAFWCGRDAGQMDRLFRSSGLYRDKWDQKRGASTYGERTIQQAIANCTEVFASYEREDIELPEPPPVREKALPPPQTPPPGRGCKPPAPPPEDVPEEAAPEPLGRYTMDDSGNARRFRDRFAQDIRYNHPEERWMCWNGRKWQEDYTGEIKRKADLLLWEMEEEVEEMIRNGAGGEPDKLRRHIRRSCSNKGKKAFLEESRHLPGVPAMPGEFDAQPWLLNAGDGVVDLRSGAKTPHKRGLYLSRITDVPYLPEASCPTWLRFLEDITGKNEELTLYIQRMLGYCLTGETREQCIFFLYGTGRNGKSTFLNIASKLLGEYAKNTQPETVMLRDKSGAAARSDLIRLQGARMVTTFELNEGSRLDEGMVKQMTGGDKLTARALYRTEVEFTPEFKIVVASNYKPVIKGADDGIWRRIRLIPFTVTIPREKLDPTLPEKLEAELPGILAWSVRGAMEWYRDGLPPCKKVDSGTAEYRTEMDKVRQFAEDCLAPCPSETQQASFLYQIYKAWSEEQGDKYPVSGRKFSEELQKAYQKHKGMLYNEFLDVGFTPKGRRIIEEMEAKKGKY